MRKRFTLYRSHIVLPLFLLSIMATYSALGFTGNTVSEKSVFSTESTTIDADISPPSSSNLLDNLKSPQRFSLRKNPSIQSHLSGVMADSCVDYRITMDADSMTYRVAFRSKKAYSGSLARITNSTQFSLVLPDPDATGSDSAKVINLTNLTALNFSYSQLNSLPENPTKDYVFFAPDNAGSYTPFAIISDTWVDVFTFEIQDGCSGEVYLYDGTTDPLASNPLYNPNQNFKVLGGGNVNLHCNNIGNPLSCPLPPPPCLDYRMTLDGDGETYRIAFRSDSAFTGSLARITNSTQISIVLPDPDSAGVDAVVLSDFTNLTALNFSYSQLNSPAENPSSDYVFAAPNNAGTYSTFDIAADTWIDVFTFKVDGGCTDSLYLYDEATDPLATNISINAAQNFKILAEGNVNLWCSNVGGKVVCSPTNEAPIAVADTVTAMEGITTVFDVQLNDSDADGDILASSIIGGVSTAGGTIAVLNGDSLSYTSLPDFVGNDTITYQVCDGGTPELCDTAIVVVTVLPVNDPPVIDSIPVVTLPEDSVITVCTTFTDPDVGDTFTAGTCGGADNGTLTTSIVLPNQLCFTYEPDSNFVGNDTLCITVCDQNGICDSMEVIVTVTPVNDAPIAVDDSTVTKEGNSLVIDVQNNDSDEEGDPLTTSIIGTLSTAGGTVVLMDNDSLTYNPPIGFSGTDTITYQICDNGTPVLCDTAMVIITVTPKPCVDYRVTHDSLTQVFTVAFRSDSVFAGSLARITNSTQFTIVMSDPDSTASGAVVLTDFTNISALNFGYTQLNSPAENPTKDYFFFAPNNAGTYTPFTIPSNTWIDVFSFKVQGDCAKEVYLYDNELDTLNANLSYNVDNNFKILAEGNVNIYCGNVGDTLFCLNEPPVIDTFPLVILPEDSVITVCVDVTDPNPSDSFTGTSCGDPMNGSFISAIVAGQLCLTYKPDSNFNGQDTFCVSVCDQTGLCDTTTVFVTVTPVNDAPIAVDDSTSTNEDTNVVIDVQDNDSDVDGDPLTTTIIGTSTAGVTPTVVNGDSISYTPPMDFVGNDTITYQVCDGGTPELCDTAIVMVTVLPVNDPPVIDSIPVVTLPEDSVITVCTTFTDPDVGDTFTAGTCGGANNGTLTTSIVLPDQLCFTYEPDSNFYGNDTLCITVCDQDGACDTMEVIVTVTPVNDAPIAVNDSTSTNEDTNLVIDVQDNDSDVDGNPLTTTVFGTSTAGVTPVVVNGDSLSYTPPTNFVGNDTITYQVCDGGTPELCDTAIVVVTVLPVNDPPVIDSIPVVTLPEDSVITVCTTFTDPDVGDTFTSGTCGGANNGTLTTSIVLPNQLCFTYEPDSNFYGNDTLCITVCDQDGVCDSMEVIVTVTPVNDPPFVGDTTLTTTQGDEISACVPVTDVDVIDTHSATICPGYPLNGTVLSQVIDPNVDELCFTYYPVPNFAGNDTVCLIICDSGNPQLCDTLVVPIVVLGDVVAINDINTTLIETTVIGDVSTNDSSVLPTTVSVVSDASNGTFSLNNDGTYSYTPDAGFTGQENMTYQICNSQGICDTADLVIQVFEPTAGNDQPIANDDVSETLENTPVAGDVLNNDFDPDNNNLVNVTQVTAPTNGSLSLNASGAYIYTPNTGFLGIDSFTYKVFDDVNPPLCDVATVVIYVTEDDNGILNNNPPVANTDLVATVAGGAVSGDMSDNDSDPNNNSFDYFATPVSGPTNGSVNILSDGTFTYIPDAGFYGTDQFTYRVCDQPAGGQPTLCDTGTVIVVVAPPTPNAINDINTVLVGETATGNLLTNDEAGELPITSTVVQGADNGTFTLNPDGSYTYVPDSGFVGEETVIYSICNSANVCDTAVLTIQVYQPSSGNNAPIANDDVSSTLKNIVVVGNVLNNDFDPENENLTVNLTPVSTPNNGSVTLLADGTFTFAPDPNFIGIDSFVYSVCDPANLCTQATVVIEVTEDRNGSTNDMPVANDDLVATALNTVVTATAKPNDSDPNGNPLLFSKATNPANGTVAMSSNGNFTYTPTVGFYGTDQFTYSVCDVVTPSSEALCDTATIYVTVLPSEPDAVNDINNTLAGETVMGNILTNDRGGELPATPSVVTGASNGTFTLNPDGSYNYEPDSAFVGQDIITYQLCNAAGLCDTAELVIQVIEPAVQANDAPVANDDVAQTTPGTLVSGSVMNNDFDLDGDVISPTLLSNPSNGSLTFDVDGTFDFTPAPGFIGTDEFTYYICDNQSPMLCDTATVTIEVLPDPTPGINDAPNAQDDATATPENTAVSGTLAPNDSDPNGDDLNYQTTSINGPSNGTVSIDASGNYTYTPDSNFVGTDQFQYVVCDDTAAPKCDTATVYLTIFNDTPPPTEIQVKVLLQGALLNTSNGLMRDDLRTGDYLPLTQPYSRTLHSRFTHVGDGGIEVATAGVLSANAGTGDAIVDWVFLEFRTGLTSGTTIQTASALVQRDGDVVAADGGPLTVQLPLGDYHVVVKHRNHLGAQTLNPKTLTVGSPLVWDFTTMAASELFANAGYDTVQQVTIAYTGGSVQALWGGNANADGKTKYDGFVNDRQKIADEVFDQQVGFPSPNLNYSNAYGYYQGDVNMNGQVKYDGFGNDRRLIQVIVRSYPKNLLPLNNYNNMVEQIED